VTQDSSKKTLEYNVPHSRHPHDNLLVIHIRMHCLFATRLLYAIYYTLWGKKTAPFYFCNNFVRSSNYWYTYTLINLEQKHIKIINLLRSVSLYCLVKCKKSVMTNVGFVT